MAVGRKTATGRNVVDVRVVAKIAGPGMKNANHANLCADEARIGSEFEESIRRGAK